MTVSVETHFPAERKDQRLEVLPGSGGDRISHVSCIFEISSRRCRPCTLRRNERLFLPGKSRKQGGNTGRSRPFLRDDFFISLMNFERKENDAGKAEEHQRRGAQSHRSG